MAIEPITLELPHGRRARCLHQAGDGPRVVLVHGAAGNADTWRPVLPFWSWADVWCPELPGRGGSSGPALDTIAELADWLAEVLDAISTRAGEVPATVVGHSMGGAIGMTLARRQPALLRGLVLVSSASRLRVAPAILAGAAAAEEIMSFAFAFAPRVDDEGIDAAEYDALCATTAPRAAYTDWRACDGFDDRDLLGEVSTPTLAIWGSADRLTPAKYQGMMVEAFPEARGVELADIGHMLPWEAPGRLASLVREWS